MMSFLLLRSDFPHIILASLHLRIFHHTQPFMLTVSALLRWRAAMGATRCYEFNLYGKIIVFYSSFEG